MNFQSIAFASSFLFLLGPYLATLPQALDANARSAQRLETTITAIVESPGKFSGKRVHVFASFHTDGLHWSVLKEPDCGLADGTSKTPPPNQPPCARGVVAVPSTNASDDNGDHALDQALAKGARGTSDKHITAEFTGKFRCLPSCTSPDRLNLEIERTENVSVEMKDINPHRPAN